MQIFDKEPDLLDRLNIIGPGQQPLLVILIHLQVFRQGHGPDADKVRVDLVHHVGGVQGTLLGVLPPAHVGHVELVDLDARSHGLDARLDLVGLGHALPHELENIIIARLQADVEAVELQLGIALQPLRLEAVDRVRPGVGRDALDLRKGRVEIFQHVRQLIGIHQQAVPVLEEDGAHPALDPMIGHGAGLVIRVRAGVARHRLLLEHVHPVFHQVDVLLHVLRRPNAERHVPVKAAEPTFVPPAPPVDAQQ